MENEILMHFRSQKKSANDIHFDEPVDSDKDGNQLCLIDIIADGEDVADKIELSIRSEQLYRYIRGEIEAGRLAAGERLPSKRALAQHLEVSIITVQNAYEQLAAEGMTLILVTHEMNFAREVGDRVVFMHQGKVWEQGDSKTLFANPQTTELKQFISSVRGLN